MLYLIRHAPVALLEQRPAHEWPLTTQGRALAELLATAPVWSTLQLIASSPEAKARDTALPIAAAAGLALRIEPALREVQRGLTPITSNEGYRQQVVAFFAQPERSVSGWEPARAAQERFVAGVERLIEHAGGPLAVVSHGLILSLYLAWLEGRGVPALQEWAAIPLPAVALVDPLARQVRLPFTAITTYLEGLH